MTRKFAGRARLIAILPVVFLMASTSLLHAQQVPRFDVFGGYAYRWFDAPSIGYPSHANLSGFNFDGTGYIFKRLGVTVDASGTYGDQLQVYDFMFGPQYTRRRPKSKLYVQGLFGKAENRADIPQLTRTHFTSVGRSYGGGAGYDYDWKDLFSIRVLQVDYFRSSTFKTTQNDIRVSTGIVFHFGHIGHKRKL
jgi:hypothetical protein